MAYRSCITSYRFPKILSITIIYFLFFFDCLNFNGRFDWHSKQKFKFKNSNLNKLFNFKSAKKIICFIAESNSGKKGKVNFHLLTYMCLYIWLLCLGIGLFVKMAELIRAIFLQFLCLASLAIFTSL